MTNNIRSDNTYSGSNTFSGPINVPASSFGDIDIEVGATPVQAEKLESQFTFDRELYPPGTEIVALAAQLLTIFRTGGELIAIEGVITTQATGADRTVTVDLEKSTAGGAFATVLTTTVDIDNTTVIRTPVAGVVNDADVIDGDIYQLTVAVAGGAANQAEGLVVTVTMRENPT